MSLQFILGGCGSGKSHYVYQEIIKRARHDNRNYLILVPDQFTMQTQKDLCTFPDNEKEGIMNIDVLSFSRLSYRIMEEVGEKTGVMLDDTGKNLILGRIAGEKSEELCVIGAHLKKLGYIHEVKSLLSEFYQYDIGDEELEELIAYSEKKGALSYKLKDLKLLKQAFAEYIKDKYITTEELLEHLCGILPKSDIIKNSVVVLDGFTGFTPVQNKLIRQLMVLSDEMIVTLVSDGLDDVRVIGDEKNARGEEQLFYLSRHTYETLSGLAKEENIIVKNEVILGACANGNVKRFEHNPELGFLERHLFRGRPCSYNEETEHIFMTEAANPKKEIQAVLLQINELVRIHGYSYRDIAVITGDMSRYEHLLQNEFDYYGVPIYMDKTNGILFHPMSEFLRSMLAAVTEDFTKESVLRFLRTALCGLKRKETDQFEKYIEAYGIRGRKRYEMLFTKGADAYETSELAAINVTRQKIVDLIAPVLRLQVSGQNKAEDIVKAIYDICVAADLQKKMDEYRQKFEEQGDLARAREYAQVFRAVIDLLDQMHELLTGEKLTLKEFVPIFEAGLSEIEIGTIPQNVDQVVVGDIERTRLKQVRALFFIGLNDGAIPKDSKGGGLLSEMEREFLRGSGHELAPSSRQQIFMQRLYLYLNMTKPSERLYLSYSRVDNEGSTIRRSYLVGVICKLFPKLAIINASKLPVLEQISTSEDGMDDLAALFSTYADGRMEQDDKLKAAFFALIDAYLKNGKAELIKEFEKAAFYSYKPDKLPKEIARALYGDIVESSVGRLERFSACAYAHFLQYGLRLKEEAEYEVNVSDIGNIYHEIMSRFSDFLKEKGYHWVDFPIGEAESFVDETMEKLSAEYHNALFYSSEESLYATKEMAKLLKRSIRTLRYHMSKGLFEPKHFELPFYVGDAIKAKGRIDRVDTFEKDGQLFVKVVDYKSGKNSFDPVEFYFGLDMQLAVYMKAAVEVEKREHKDKNVVPAALVYYQLQNPFVEEKENELRGSDGSVMDSALEDKILEQMKLTGLVSEEEEIIMAMDRDFSSDSDVMQLKLKKNGAYTKDSIIASRKQFELLMEYVDYKMNEVGKKVYDGNIEINPYIKKNQNACQYCSYKGICHFDKKVDGYQMRYLDNMDETGAWLEIEKALKKEQMHGN